MGLEERIILAAIQEGMSAVGWSYDVALVDGTTLNNTLAEVSSDIELLVIGGGDGTLVTGAQEAMRRNIPMGLIPLGTMNLFARDLGIPQDITRSLKTLKAGKRRHVDVAYINDMPFLNAVVVGRFAQLAKHRENIRKDGAPLPRPSRIQGIVQDVARYRRSNFRIECDEKVRSLRAGTIQITNNPLKDTPTVVPERQSLSTGKLGCYIDKSRSKLGFVKASLLAITGGMPDDPAVERSVCKCINITPQSKEMSVTIDGEIRKVAGPMRFWCARRALEILGGA